VSPSALDELGKIFSRSVSARGLIITALNQVVQVFNCSGLSASGFTATYSKKEGRAAALYFEERGADGFISSRVLPV
jgi:hypothetical protein